jgi:dTDP-4-amino-4,6-dideoxygalactose transaminase
VKRPGFVFHDLLAGYRAQEEEILAAMRRVLESGRYMLDREVRGFEDELAQYLGAPHVVGTGSGTDALELALMALGVGAGDEVVVPALTAAPTAMAVCAVGARPVFVDIDRDTYTMDPSALAAALTPRTRAVIPVHLYGQCADVPAIEAAIGDSRVAIIEDAAQAHGARLEGRMAGTLGRVGCLSFYPTKNLGAYGDAGAVVTADGELADRMRKLRSYGQIEGYDFVAAGTNARLDELHAAVLRVKLRALDQGNALRRSHADAYRSRVRSPHVRLPVVRPGCIHVYHQFVVRSAARDPLRKHLAERGVETLIHYPRALHHVAAFRDRGRSASRPIEAERAVAEIVSLPIYPELPPAALEATIGALNDFVAPGS